MGRCKCMGGKREGGAMEWIYRLRWDSRECDGFIMKWVYMGGDWLL